MQFIRENYGIQDPVYGSLFNNQLMGQKIYFSPKKQQKMHSCNDIMNSVPPIEKYSQNNIFLIENRFIRRSRLFVVQIMLSGSGI